MWMLILQRWRISFECWTSKRDDEMTMTTVTVINHRMDVHDSTWMKHLMLTISDFESDSDFVATKDHEEDHLGTKKLMWMSTSRIAPTVIMITIMSLVTSCILLFMILSLRRPRFDLNQMD